MKEIFLDLLISDSHVEYPQALSVMEELVERIIQQDNAGTIWFLEHPHVYTKGTTANDSDLLSENGIPVYEGGRGGKYTYHGPGQRVVYFMVNLKKIHREPDIRLFISQLEQIIINALADLNIEASRNERGIGVWVLDEKIASIGVRVKKWVSFHGIAVNVKTDLHLFDAIVPCGIQNVKICSIESLGHNITLSEWDSNMINSITNVLGIKFNAIQNI